MITEAMARKPQAYHLPPTQLVPNSPYPLLYYPSFFQSTSAPADLAAIHTHVTSNSWAPQWIIRYGTTQASHYHSQTHECMVVLSGHARIRFGVADSSPAAPIPPSSPSSLSSPSSPSSNSIDDKPRPEPSNSSSSGTEQHNPAEGLELDAQAGDVFILPAGTAHKTFNTQPEAPFALLTPGEPRGVSKQGLEGVALEGFTMLGAYPVGSREWDFRTGGEDVGGFERVWGTPLPDRDPVLGEAGEGLLGLWKG